MKVPQFAPWVGQEEYKAIASCFEQNWITEGPKSKEFVQKLLELMGAKYGVLANNGTLALYLALKAMGIKPGDEVILPDSTFIGSANAIEMIGAIPVMTDVNNTTFQIDVSKADKLITNKTRAIMPVHVFGTSVKMDVICDFAKKYNLMIIEDAAAAIGITYKGKHAGTWGETGTFSFFADKTITTGEGGFVVTNNEDIYEKLLYYRNQGRLDRGTWIHPEIGYNFRMTDIQSAIGIVQLSKLKEIEQRKMHNRSIYFKRLKGHPKLRFFEAEESANLIPYRVTIVCEKAHELMQFLRTKEVEPRTFFYPVHMQPCYKYLQDDPNYKFPLKDDNFPNSVFGYENIILLPSFVGLLEAQINHVCDAIEEFYGDK